MSMTQTASQIPHAPASRAAARSAAVDGGPWLFLAAPLSFAVVLAIAIYLSSISF